MRFSDLATFPFYFLYVRPASVDPVSAAPVGEGDGTVCTLTVSERRELTVDRVRKHYTQVVPRLVH